MGALFVGEEVEMSEFSGFAVSGTMFDAMICIRPNGMFGGFTAALRRFNFLLGRGVRVCTLPSRRRLPISCRNAKAIMQWGMSSLNAQLILQSG